MNGDPPPQTNKSIITIVILTLAVCTVIGMCTYAYCMIFAIHTDAVVSGVFGPILGACLGYLAGVLSKTSPTETTKHVDVSTQPIVTDATVKPEVI